MFKKNLPALGILAVLVLTAYLGSLNSAFVADDVPIILNNDQIDKPNFIFSSPLTLFSGALYFGIVKVFGRLPAGFRVANILFHLGNVWLLYLLLRILFDFRTALFAAAILAVHPLQTEAVTWISGGMYARYSFFLLLALALYILNDARENKKLYWASMGSFVLALLNSEKAMVFPFLLLVLEFSYQGLRKNWKRLIFPFALGGFWALIFISKIGERVTGLQTMYYQSPQTTNPLAQIPIAITSYLKLIFWPKDLTLYHSEMSFSSVEFYSRVVILLIFLGLVAWACKKSKPVFFWLSFFVISLLPMLTPFGISWIVAERYVYLGAIGIFVAVAMVINRITDKITEKIEHSLFDDRTDIFYGLFNKSKISYIILIPILLALTARTIVRNQDWNNQDTLWLAAAKTSPSSPQNHNNLGDLYGRRGDLERSAAEFKKAIELKPGYADAYHNLANTYQQMGKIDEAIESYQKAFEFNPRLWQSCQNLAVIYFEQEKFELARDWMEKAIKVNPENSNLRRNLEIIKAH